MCLECVYVSAAAWLTGGGGRARAGVAEEHKKKQRDQQTGTAKESAHGSE